MTDPIVSLIAPRRVAVFGGSNDPRKLGNFLLENLKRYGYEGDILPVHPREKQVAGLKAYPSLDKLPQDPDVALICLPASAVREVVTSCAEVGIRSAIVYACGFGEGDQHDETEKEELRKLAQEKGIRILGPNCMGAYNVAGRFNATFFKDLPTEPGEVGFISQAGSVGGILFHGLKDLGVGLSKYFATGNMVDIDQTDLLLHLAHDPQTRVIALYLETMQNPARFLKEAAKVALDKPTVVFKSGTTAAGGARRPISHREPRWGKRARIGRPSAPGHPPDKHHRGVFGRHQGPQHVLRSPSKEPPARDNDDIRWRKRRGERRL